MGTGALLIFASIAVAAALFAAGGMIYGNQPVPAIWLYFSATVLSLSAICIYWQHTVLLKIANPPFSTAIETAMLGTNRDAAFVGAIFTPSMVCPIPVALYMRIVNLQPFSVDIDQLTIEVEATKGKWYLPASWIEGERIPDEIPLVVLRHPPSDSLPITLLGHRLTSRLESGPIQPRETVRGWILFDMPLAYDSIPQPATFRITLKDTAGDSLKTIIPEVESKDAIGPDRGIQWSGRIDLTGYRIGHIIDSRSGAK